MGDESVEGILAFLAEGDRLIKFSSSQEAVLVLGTTGTGKTTLTHFLALDNNDMVSVRKGVGDYVIQDNTKEICDSTIKSCTVIPELVIDQKANNTAYYDCPGFSDTRGAAHDIGSTYFIQKVIQRTRTIKFIFTISYDSVREGGDRQAFMNLAKHVFSMFKRIDTFENSACLVVTKVDNIVEEVEEGTYRRVPDDEMIQNIVGFLEQTKDNLETELKTNPTSSDQFFYKNTITLINIFINKKLNPRIGIFRRPNKQGPISKIKLLQDGKRALSKMIYQELSYSVCNGNDFGYTISDKSKLHLNALKDSLKTKISHYISIIGRQMQDYYSKQEETSNNIDVLGDSIKNANQKLSNLASTKDKNAGEFANKMVAVVNELGFEVSAENVEEIVNCNDYLVFIESLMESTVSELIAWGSSLSDVLSYTSKSDVWYSLLIDLRITLSEYAIQRDTGKYSGVTNKLLDAISTRDQESITLSFRQFLSVVNENSGRDYTTPDMDYVDENKFKFLEELVRLCFGRSNIDCTKNTLTVKGNFVKMKDIALAPCFNHSNEVLVFALVKIFLDVDFKKPQGELIMLAPEFEAMNQLTFNIDGAEGSPQHTQTERNGRNGLPGKPGSPGGGLAWISNVCTNCDKVIISAMGGRGGGGQKGEDGRKGQDGESSTTFTCTDREWSDKNGFHYDPSDRVSCTTKKFRRGFSLSSRELQHCSVLGKPGTKGGSGGNGGKGGLGGKAGEVHTIFSKYYGSERGPTIKKGEGSVGEGGDGGKGGEGGTQGETISADFEKIHNWVCTPACFIISTDYSCHPNMYEKVATKAESGKDGQKDMIMTNRQFPGSIHFIPYVGINQYKEFLRHNVSNPIINARLNEFLRFIEVDDRVNGLYDTTGFVDDLLLMESRLYSKSHETVQVRSYENFLKRIREYANHREMNEDDKLVLGYLYTTILSKMCSIKENSSIEVVIDIKSHLKLASEDIKKLVAFAESVNRYKVKSEYQDKIMDKINEANYLINTTMSQNVDVTIQELRNDMQSLLRETISREEQAENERMELIREREQLESQMGWSIGLGILQGIGTVLGFLGPVGMMIGSTIGSVNTVAQGLLVDGESGDDVISKLPAGINKLLGDMKAAFKAKQDLYRRQLTNAEKILKGVESDSMIITNLLKGIGQTKTELDEMTEKAVSGDRAAIEGSYNVKKDLTATLENSLKRLKDQNEKSEEKSKIDRCIDIVTKVQNIMSVAEVGIDIYETVTSTKRRIHTLNEAIAQKEDQISLLKSYEKEIYSTMLPMAQGIKDDIDNAVKTSAGTSHAALDVSGWKVQTALRAVKNQLKQMTDGFDSQNEILNTVDKVMYALTAMMQIFDHIQYYYEQAQLADYITGITSDRANSILEYKIKDGNMKEDIAKLQLEIHTNMVLAAYDKTMSAVRQYVFPFATNTGAYNLPEKMRVSNTSLEITDVVNKIVSVLHKLENDVTVINSRDVNIFPKQRFNSRDKENPPFYVWKYRTNSNVIVKLLQGKEIVLNANIAKGIQENAIKFNNIGVYFKTHCKELQDELETALQGFSIQLTLMGNSYYRCANKFFVMTHGHIIIQHSVNRKDGEYYNQNEVYDKIKLNDPMLSPYGAWKMKLVGDDFNKLARYIGRKVDIELEGLGSYLNHEEDEICTDDLKQFYQDVSESSIRRNSKIDKVVDNDDTEECENQQTVETLRYHQAINRRTGLINETTISVNQHPTEITDVALPTILNGRRNTNDASFLLPPRIQKTPENSSAIQSVNYNLLDVQGNLLLMDMFIRRMNRNNKTRSLKRNSIGEEYAHQMAYNAYAP